MYMNKKQTFSDLNGSDSDKNDVESSLALAVKRSYLSFVRKYDASYLHIGFIATDDAGMPKPQCAVCKIVLSNVSMKPSNLMRHLHLKPGLQTRSIFNRIQVRVRVL